MLTALSEFLTSATEDLRKILQPSSLFAAVVLVALNWALVLPLLADDRNPVALALLGLSDTWQSLLATVLVLTLSYLLLSLNTTILRLMSGESWADSPFFGKWFIRWQIRDYNKHVKTVSDTGEQLHAEVNQQANEPTSAKRQPQEATATTDAGSNSTASQKSNSHIEYTPTARLNVRFNRQLFELYTYYPKDSGYIAPTMLGNALNATVIELWQRYRIDMGALWPHMETVLPKDTPIVQRLNDEKAALDFLLNLAFVLNLFAVEYVLLYVLIDSSYMVSPLWVAICVLLLAYVVYRAAVGKARSWGDTVQLVFDIYRDTLHTKLGLASSNSIADERTLWEKASRWFLWQPSPEMLSKKYPPSWPDNIFANASSQAPASAPSLSWDTSSNIAVKMERTTFEPRILVGRSTESPSRVIWYQQLDYLAFLETTDTPVASLDESQPVNGAVLSVVEPRAPFLDQDPVLLNRSDWGYPSPRPTRVTVDDQPYTHKLIWHIPPLPPRSARTLRYRLRVPVIDAQVNAPTLYLEPVNMEGQTASGPYRYTFKMTNRGDQPVRPVRLEVKDIRLSRQELDQNVIGFITRNTSPDDEETIEPLRAHNPRRYRWDLGTLMPDQSVMLSYELEKEEAHDEE